MSRFKPSFDTPPESIGGRVVVLPLEPVLDGEWRVEELYPGGWFLLQGRGTPECPHCHRGGGVINHDRAVGEFDSEQQARRAREVLVAPPSGIPLSGDVPGPLEPK